MQKPIRAIRQLSKSLEVDVQGLFDVMEHPSLELQGYSSRVTIPWKPDWLDSPLSVELGMRLHPLYDPSFPPAQLLDRIAQVAKMMRDADPNIKRMALMYVPGPEGKHGIDIYTSSTEESASLRASVSGIDVTPEIYYGPDGNALAVVTFCVYNGTWRARSVMRLTSTGEYNEWHEDPEHGNWPAAEVVPRKRLEDLETHNPHSIPKLAVLGADEKTVRLVLADKGLVARHFAYTPNTDLGR